MPRRRFTVGWLIVALVVAAVLIQLKEKRSARFRALSVFYQSRRTLILSGAGSTPRDGGLAAATEVFDLDMQPVMGVRARKELWYDFMAAKYDRAARFPLLRVAPDPPEPE